MRVTENTIERIAQEIRDYVTGWHLAYLMMNETAGWVGNFSVQGKAYANWGDGSPEIVRIRQHDSGTPYIAFSACHYFNTIELGQSVDVSIEGVKMRWTSGSGERWLGWFKREQELEDEE